MQERQPASYPPPMLRCLLATAVLIISACAHGAGRAEPLDILLTNDDGYDAAGLVALRAALVADGHTVSVVAPSGNRSGSSVGITTQGSLRWRAVEPDVIAVEGTPADCVRLALTTLRSDAPDLVVSGINFGQNVGSGTLSSGTVGAALTALNLGVPSIAFSQTVDANDVRGTVRYFPAAASFSARLVTELRALQSGLLLPDAMMLNVNYPARSAADVRGAKLTRQGRSTLYSVVYTREGDRSVSIAFAPGIVEETIIDADTSALAAGYISVTPLDGDWSSLVQKRDSDALSSLQELVRRLGAAVERAPVGGAR